MPFLSWTKTALNTPTQALSHLLNDGSNIKLLVLLLVFFISFWVYVPIHELMHAFATILVGGEVKELAIDATYGGVFFAKIFPFVVSESDYAGQLTDFTTRNKFAYFIVDMFPYLLSLPGVLLIRLAAKYKRLWLFSIGFLLMLVPMTQIFGDFYEVASLGMGEIMSLLNPSLNPDLIVSDDMFKLISSTNENSNKNFLIYISIGFSFILGLILAWLTIIIQVPFANLFLKNANQ